jgi:hypothetical protein
VKPDFCGSNGLAAQCPEKIDFSAERAEGFAAAL